MALVVVIAALCPQPKVLVEVTGQHQSDKHLTFLIKFKKKLPFKIMFYENSYLIYKTRIDVDKPR